MAYGGKMKVRTRQIVTAMAAVLAFAGTILIAVKHRELSESKSRARRIAETKAGLHLLTLIALDNEIPMPTCESDNLTDSLRFSQRQANIGVSSLALDPPRVLDAWEHPIWIRRLPDLGGVWFFVSGGPNGNYDGGTGDDITQPFRITGAAISPTD